MHDINTVIKHVKNVTYMPVYTHTADYYKTADVSFCLA